MKILNNTVKILIFGYFILFLFGCSSYKKVTDFSEASGICYMQASDSFFVVGDEGEIQKIDSSGKKLEYFKFEKNYDLESVICDNENNALLSIDEATGEVLQIDIKNNFSILKKYKIKGYTLNKDGIEGFTHISDNKYIISTQTEKDNLLILYFKNNEFSVSKKINFQYSDLSGLDYYNGELYILSDDNNSIYKYDIETETIIEQIELKKGSWEGISINRQNGDIFLANDDGKIVQYK